MMRPPLWTLFATWLASAAQRWRPSSVRELRLNLQYGWLRDPGHEGWDFRHCSPESAAALEAALEAVLARHASGLQLLELTGGGTRVHGPDEASLGRIVALLEHHAPQLHQLRRLEVEQDFAAEALAPALGSLQVRCDWWVGVWGMGVGPPRGSLRTEHLLPALGVLACTGCCR